MNTGTQTTATTGHINQLSFGASNPPLTEFNLMNGQVESDYSYFSGYKPKRLTEQTACLQNLFPGIGTANEKLAEGTLPLNAEGWFAIPRWERIASTYNEALRVVLNLFEQTHRGKFHIHCEDQLGPEQLRQTAHAQQFWKRLGDEQQGNDILVVPAQFGLRYRGCSVRYARQAMAMQNNEFPLGAVAVGIMLLTHPKRLTHYNDLYIDCAGDEFNSLEFTDMCLSHNPAFFHDGRNLRFGMLQFNEAHAGYGSASAFVAQQ